jgi:hypothetical protein
MKKSVKITEEVKSALDLNTAAEMYGAEKIDITPTWQVALQIYLMALDSGSSKGRMAAIEGLEQMANIAQRHVEVVDKLKKAGINPDEL